MTLPELLVAIIVWLGPIVLSFVIWVKFGLVAGICVSLLVIWYFNFMVKREFGNMKRDSPIGERFTNADLSVWLAGDNKGRYLVYLMEVDAGVLMSKQNLDKMIEFNDIHSALKCCRDNANDETDGYIIDSNGIIVHLERVGK